MSTPLAIEPCRKLCSWRELDEQRAGEPLFRCGGCGSEWVPSEPWTPVNHTGVVPRSVQRAVQRVRSRLGRG